MAPSIPDALLKSAAFKLFVEELTRHVSTAQARIQTGLALDAEECRMMGAAFHTVRGSAGFFNLQEISVLSKQIEEHLLDEQVTVPFDLGPLRPLVEQLQLLTNKLCADLVK